MRVAPDTILSLARTFKNQINRFRHAARHSVSFAQCGEDLIIDYCARTLGLREFSYLDIGAHHPSYLSNTYFFYRQGRRGVCVEPDVSLLPPFRRQRPGDVLLNIGVGPEEGAQDFFVMTTPTLNTFSRQEARRYESYGNQRVERVEQVQIRCIDSILAEHFAGAPQLVSLDVEGLDFDILRSLDFARVRPPIICVETLTYAEDGTERKLTEIVEFMRARDYFDYADTYVNTIFVDRTAWSRRPGARAGA